MNLYELLGKRIKVKRRQLGLTQEELSEMCGLAPGYVGIIERAEKRASIETLVKIANGLEVSADYLLCDSLEYRGSTYIEKTSSLLRDMDENEQRLAYKVAMGIFGLRSMEPAENDSKDYGSSTDGNNADQGDGGK